MKKIFVTIAATIVALGSAYAQDLATVTEMYNNGAAAIASDKASALSMFEQALEAANALGDEGKEVAQNCIDVIPNLNLSIAKDLVKAANYDSALEKLKAAIEVAEKFSDSEVSAEATKLIPQVMMQKGNSLLNAKNYEAAAAAYQDILNLDASNGAAALRLGAALNAAGKAAEAKAAFEQAAANGQESQAKKQLGTIFLKEAAAALKTKSYAAAVEAAVKSNEYKENPQAIQIAGQASQLAGKNSDAIKYFEQYLQMAPSASNAGQIAYTIGALYQQAKNIEKAKEFYQKATTDAKFGAEAKKLLDALK